MLILKVSDFFNLLGLPREVQSDVAVCRPHPPSWSLLFSFLGFVLRSVFWQPAAAGGGFVWFWRRGWCARSSSVSNWAFLFSSFGWGLFGLFFFGFGLGLPFMAFLIFSWAFFYIVFFGLHFFLLGFCPFYGPFFWMAFIGSKPFISGVFFTGSAIFFLSLFAPSIYSLPFLQLPLPQPCYFLLPLSFDI